MISVPHESDQRRQVFLVMIRQLSMNGIVNALVPDETLDARLDSPLAQFFQTTIYIPPSSTQAVANFIQGNAPYAISAECA